MRIINTKLPEDPERRAKLERIRRDKARREFCADIFDSWSGSFWTAAGIDFPWHYEDEEEE